MQVSTDNYVQTVKTKMLLKSC